MLKIDIDPVVTEIGSLTIRWDLCLALIAGIIALGYFYYVSRRLGLPRVHIVWIGLSVVLSGIIFSRLLVYIEYMLYFHRSLPFLGFGMRAHGLFLGAIAVIWAYTRGSKISFAAFADTGLPAALLFMAFYRIGCVLIGCCYGTPTDLPWAVIYTNPASRAPLNIPIHPTQLYHLTWNVTMFVTALILKLKLRRPGLTAQIVLIVYFLGDFIIRLFRGDDTIIAGISLSQMVAAAILLASLLTMILSGMKRLRPANP